mgnify:CR=1 FL=1
MADFGVGTRGTLRITDDGSVVRFYVLCSDSQTFNYGYQWFGTVNNTGVGGTVSLGKGFGSRELGAWGVGYSQNVSIGQQATGTSGLGGYYSSPGVYIGRATVPGAPYSLGVDQATATSLRYRFSGTTDGGSGILEWQIGYGTSPSNTQFYVGSSGTSTIGGLAEHTTWYFWSRGRNAVGWGPWSGRDQGNTLGHPTVPLNVSTTPSTGVSGRIAVNWNAPTTTGAGGITGYTIYRDGVQIATTTGTGTSYIDNGRTPYQTYAYRVAARNAYSATVSGTGPQSAAVNAVAPGPPSAPRDLEAVADDLVPGKVDLTWVAPVNTGAGGITGYRIYFSGGDMVAQTTGTGTSYTVTGLTPGTTYSFQVFALNSLATTEGSMSAGSNTSAVTPIGEPSPPSNLTVIPSPVVGNRLILSWTPPAGTLSGYSVFSRLNGVDTLVKKITPNHTTFTVDTVPGGTTRNYVVRARTAYTDTLTDGYPGNWGGPSSSPVGNTATNDSHQSVNDLPATTSGTNATFNGTYTITNVSNNSISYNKTAANIPAVSSGGTVANITNAIFNGTFAIAASPNPNQFTYSKTNVNVPSLNVFGGAIANNTNVSMNATNVQVTAVNSGARTLTYTKAGTAVATVAVPTNTPPGARGTVTNLTNASFNVTGKIITEVTSTTIKYAQTGSNVAENNAAGIVTNVTNQSVYNGIRTVLAVPDYKTITVDTYAGTETTETRTWNDPTGTVERSTSTSKLNVRYRSGWIG